MGYTTFVVYNPKLIGIRDKIDGNTNIIRKDLINEKKKD